MSENSSQRWFGLAFISLAVALIIVDSTIVNVAVPDDEESAGAPADAAAHSPEPNLLSNDNELS